MDPKGQGQICFRFTSDHSSGEVDTICKDDETPVRVLKVGNAFQSATFLDEHRFELPFEYYKGFDCIFDANPRQSENIRMLLLGGGACSYPKHVLTTMSDVSMVVIERDAKVIEIARNHFFLSELEDKLESEDDADRLQIVIDDAYDYLSNSEERFDAIVNDLFQGEHPDPSLLDQEALDLIKAHLNLGGIYLINYVCGQEPADFSTLHDVLLALKRSFGYAYAMLASDEEFSDYDNYIIAASSTPYAFNGEISGLLD